MVRVRAFFVMVMVLAVAGAPVQAASAASSPSATDGQTPPADGGTAANATETVRLVVTFENDTARQQADLESAGLGVTVVGGRDVEFMPVLFVTAPPSSIGPLSNRTDVESVVRDQPIGTPEPIESPAEGSASSHRNQVTSWGADKIGAPAARQQVTDSAQADVQVAVLDTGVDYDHPDLSDNVVWGVSYVGGTERTGLAAADDSNGHGTEAAGIIAAEDNNRGVVGVSPNTEIYSIQVVDRLGFGYYSWWVSGIDAALKGPDGTIGTDDDAEVISMSLGGPFSQPNLKNAVDRAQQHAIVVASAGNSGDGDPTTNEIGYPAKYNSSLAVAATYRNDTTTTFSSEGAEVDVAAPGYEVQTTGINGGTTLFSGTSAAAPFVSGALALLIAEDLEDGSRDRSNREIVNELRRTAVDIDSPGTDNKSGDGRIAVDAAIGANGSNSAPTAVTGPDQAVRAGTTVTLNASGSSDPDGDTLSYSWRQTGGPQVSLSQSGSTQPTFTAPNVSSATSLTFTVTVTDGNGGTDTNTTVVTVSPARSGGPNPGRYDVDGDGTFEPSDLQSVIDAYNNGTDLGGQPVTASNVTEAISIYNR